MSFEGTSPHISLSSRDLRLSIIPARIGGLVRHRQGPLCLSPNA